jgi:hypothetical protein
MVRRYLASYFIFYKKCYNIIIIKYLIFARFPRAKIIFKNMKKMFGKAKRVLIAFLVFIFAISLVSPALADSMGISIGAVMTATDNHENLIYANAKGSSYGNLLKLQLNGAGTDRFVVDRSGNVTAFGDICGNGKCLSTSASQWTSGSGLIYYNTGNVGIGTANPGQLLHLYKATGPTDIRLQAGNYGTYWDINQDSAGLGFNYNGTGEVIKLATSGNVGIGTATPGAKLTVQGDGGSTGLFSVNGTNNGNEISMSFNPSGTISATNMEWIIGRAYNANKFAIRSWDGTTDANRITLDSSGNVGIGTAGPYAKLQVAGGSISIDQDQAYRAANQWLIGQDSGTNFIHIGSTGVANSIGFQSTSGDLMRILSNGNVGIGNTSPTSRLVVGNSTSGSGVSSVLNVTNNNDADEQILISQVGAASKYGMIQSSVSNLPLILNGTNGGNVGIGTTNPTGQMSGTQGLGIYSSTYPAIGFRNPSATWLWYAEGSTFKMWNNSAGDMLTANTGRYPVSLTLFPCVPTIRIYEKIV